MAIRWVVKCGTGVLTRPNGQLDSAQITRLTGQIAALVRRGDQVVLVTSGAVGAGMRTMALDRRPTRVSELQACATVGQPQLMLEYHRRFRRHGLQPAQFLLTYWDLDSRTCYRNAQATIEHLLSLRAYVPVINENDAIAADEIRVGDNDRLSAHVAVMVRASRLVILSNVDGLLDKANGGAVIPEVRRIDDRLRALASGTQSQLSVGGMVTKLLAAEIAAEAGIETWVANGRRPGILLDVARGKGPGTRFRLPRSKEKGSHVR
ncbi:MAG: glutamate 5-kinase [Verrucomicrobiae bacterium]|nr:glutamate 5-kinase [Verrucomicrobiae bacterium]